jgi:hypothetical protein
VPARERRPGYRPVELPASVATGVEAELAGLEQLDAGAQVRELSRLMSALDQLNARLAQLRLDAVADMREANLTYEQIAEQSGLSYARVAQLARAAKGQDSSGR